MIDDRGNQLLKLKEVSCQLKKQRADLTKWFISRLALFNALAERPDAETPQLVNLRNRILTLLKFVGKPNDTWRKDAVISEYWPPIEQELGSLPSA